MCLADPSVNPRPNRIINLLSDEGFAVDVLSYSIRSIFNLPIENHFLIEKRKSINLTFRIFRGAFFRSIHFIALCISFTPYHRGLIERYIEIKYNLISSKKIFKNLDYDLLIVEHLYLLPLALRVRKNAKIIFDAREYYPKEYEDDWTFRVFESQIIYKLCQYYLSKCDHWITVSPGLAKAYKDEFGVDMQIIRSTPPYQEFSVQKTVNSRIKMVHHGVANRDRGIENMIEIVKSLDKRFTLDLYLVGDDSYRRELEQIAAGYDRIRFCEPVPFKQIISMLNKYDIGFYYLKPVGFNVTYNLPNKFFEFIQARLAIAIGPSPDMEQIVNEFKCGFVSPEFTLESMIGTLNTLTTEEIDRAKHQSNVAAQTLCYENESKKMLVAINELISFSRYDF